MRVLVVGAGISGLSLAHYLQRTMGPAVNVVLAEKGKSIGGWVQSRFLKGTLFTLFLVLAIGTAIHQSNQAKRASISSSRALAH
jgi:protoporphyrinogen oxidase